MRKSLVLLAIVMIASSCGILPVKGAKTVKPKTHKVWKKGNRYVIDIPVGKRHIQLFERKRTRSVRMN